MEYRFVRLMFGGRLIFGGFYLVWEDFGRRFGLHCPPVQVEISLRTLIPLSPQWLTDLRR